MDDRADHLVQMRRADSQLKASRVRTALEAMAEAGEPLGVAALARRARVSRRFIYDHPELRAELLRHTAEAAERYRDATIASSTVSIASLRADLANAKDRNHRLEAELGALKRRLGQAIGAEVMADAIGVAAPDHVALQAKLAATEDVLAGDREQLARCAEELAAARQINRELLARVNRSPT